MYKVNVYLESAVQETVPDSGTEDDMKDKTEEVIVENQEPEGESGPTGVTQVEAPPETPTTDVSDVPADSEVVAVQEKVEGSMKILVSIAIDSIKML